MNTTSIDRAWSPAQHARHAGWVPESPNDVILENRDFEYEPSDIFWRAPVLVRTRITRWYRDGRRENSVIYHPWYTRV